MLLNFQNVEDVKKSIKQLNLTGKIRISKQYLYGS